MFWPILECSIATAGLWFARRIVPYPFMSYADMIALGCIILMFIWLAKRARKQGEQRGVTDYRRLRRAAARHALTNDRATPDAREIER